MSYDTNKELAEIDIKLDQTLDEFNHIAGPLRDTMRLVVPMLKDITAVMRHINAKLEAHASKLEHLPGKE